MMNATGLGGITPVVCLECGGQGLLNPLHNEGCSKAATPADPYGVPTGAVPRYVRPPGHIHNADLERERREGSIAQAVDDWLLMERKARAWDELRAYWAALPDAPARMEVARMDALVHPAQPAAPATR